MTRLAALITRVPAILALIWLFARELVLSAIRVGVLVLQPDLKARLRPAMLAFPLTVKSDLAITLLANLITLTPGTLSVDVSADKAVLFIHVIDLADQHALTAEIAGGFERRVAAVLL